GPPRIRAVAPRRSPAAHLRPCVICWGSAGPAGTRRRSGVRLLLPFVEQLHAFAMTIAAGMAAGLLFDMYRLARRGLRPRGTGAWLLDLMFWLVATPVVFALLLVANWGEL